MGALKLWYKSPEEKQQNGILNLIVASIKSDEFDTISKQRDTISATMGVVIEIINNLHEITGNLFKIGLIGAITKDEGVTQTINLIGKIIKNLSEITLKDIEADGNNIDNLKDIIVNISIISLLLTAQILLFIPAILGAVLMSLTILCLMGIVWMLSAPVF